MTTSIFRTLPVLFALVLRMPAAVQTPADEVVVRLGELGPDGLPATAKSMLSEKEQLRLELYKRLNELGGNALPALARGLRNPDVLVRRNVALFLAAGRSSRSDPGQSEFNIRMALPALVAALGDSDEKVRWWSAQAIGRIGPDAASAVPALIGLLRNEDEGSRNSACIALRGIGPAAKDALPALRQALSDPSANVRTFAARAIQKIEGQ